MKKILVILLLVPVFANAQNIVPNYSFEQADSCPTDENGYGRYRYSLGCVGWGQATRATPDYFNACDTAAISVGLAVPNSGVPLNWLGYQSAYEGVAYTGAIMLEIGDSTYKEYLIASIPALDIDSAYKVTIHISLADLSTFAIGGFGVLFTTYGSPDTATQQTLTETPQIDYTSSGTIADTAHWVTLSDTFISDSAYTNLIIGVFKPYYRMNVERINASGNGYAYYYFDNVVVQKLSSATGFLSLQGSAETKVFPNPATTSLTIKSPGEITTLIITNMVGQTVFTNHYHSEEVQVDVADVPPGLYLVRINSTDVRKFVKE